MNRAITNRNLAMLAVIVSAFFCAHAAGAREDAILVLDASGSMWGQIDGVNKIVIAKDVVEELTYKIPAERRLGLVAYGHRRQGDCEDIETLADVGVDRAGLRDRIRDLNPRGKTPLSASVQHAAEKLNYTKNKSTVILVSDGKETCDLDPCELGRLLEQNGLDFTVHVIGFDVTMDERKGLQCLAQETGGQFLAADNADQLAAALDEVAAGESDPTPPQSSEPKPVQIVLKATILQGGPLIRSNLDWNVTPKAGDEPVFSQANTGTAETEVPPGDYRVDVVWHGWKHGGEKTGSLDITLRPQQVDVITVPVDLDLPVTLQAPDSAAEGELIDVTWDGPDHLSAHVNISEVESGPLDSIFFLFPERARKTANVQTGPVTAKLHTPPIPGDYEIRYVLRDPPVILARRPITLTELEYTLKAPAEAPISTPITVQWAGQRMQGDFLTIIEKSSRKTFENGRTGRLNDDGTAEITTPPEPGDYELRYVTNTAYNSNLAYKNQVQASIPIRITAVEASLKAPATAEGGSTIEVEWSGPQGADNDWISVVRTGAKKANRDSTLSRLADRQGVLISPAPIRVPAIPGDYEIVYIVQPGAKIVARTPITIVASHATVEAPQTVKAGTPFEVQYSGAGFPGDRVVMVKADRADNSMWGVTLRYGFPARADQTTGQITGWTTQDAPGEYEVRYVTGLQHQILARQKITVTE